MPKIIKNSQRFTNLKKIEIFALLRHNVVCVVKPTTALIKSHFSAHAKFCDMPWKYQNAEKRGKLRASAWNSVARIKMQALRITDKKLFLYSSKLQNKNKQTN